MDEDQLRVFVSIVQKYFESETGKGPDTGSPYLGDSTDLPMLDFTGVIGISGVRQGCVYITAGPDLLRALLLHVGETDVSDHNLCDLAGEIANTISGNARLHFGADFMISVPVIVRGAAQAIHMPRNTKAYVIPFRWRKHPASLVVSLQ